MEIGPKNVRLLHVRSKLTAVIQPTGDLYEVAAEGNCMVAIKFIALFFSRPLVVSQAKSLGLGCAFFRPASLFVVFNDTVLRPPLALPNEKYAIPTREIWLD